jgi:hypothetical protein
MATYKKGESGNPHGRPRGAKTRTGAEVQAALLKLIDENIDLLNEDLKKLKPKDRASLIINLAKHVTAPAINPERLTEEQLEQIVEYLKNQNNNE